MDGVDHINVYSKGVTLPIITSRHQMDHLTALKDIGTGYYVHIRKKIFSDSPAAMKLNN